MSETITTDAIYERVVKALVDFGADPDEITPEATFESLDIDSLDFVELGQIVEDEYNVVLKDENLKEVRTVGQVTELIAARVAEA